MPNSNLSQGAPMNSVPQIFSHESVEAAVITAVGHAIHTLEPQLQKFATQVAHQAVDKSQELAERTYRRVQRQPLMLVGIAAFALAGIAAMMIFKNQSSTPRITH